MSSEKKPPVPTPRVEVVVRRPAGTTPAATPTVRPSPTPAPTPRPTAATPAPVPSPAAPRAYTPGPRPTGAGPAVGARPSFGPPRSGPPGAGAGPGGFRKGPPRFSSPRTPPTVEQINELAKRERVPARIAKGELEGKMKCRIWRKLHAEEAKRFDQAYTLMEQHPELDLQDAFGVVQSGRTPAEFLAKKARGKVKAEIKEARGALPGGEVEVWLNARKDAGDEVCFVLGDRTLVDKLKELQPVAFVLERTGRIEKLQVVLAMRKEQWEALTGTLERDPRLTRKPVAVQRQPDRRPVADPRLFVPHVGQTLRLELRNGISLRMPLLAVGPFDVLLGEAGKELFVPLHAMLRWEVAA